MIPYTTHPEQFSWVNIKEGLKSLALHAIILAGLIAFMLLFAACGTTRQVAIVDRVHQDTIYLNKMQYDSIFINQYHSIDRGSDTIYVEDVKVEYRYRLLRDTIKEVRIDSIPVIKEVEVTKEVRYIPWWSKALNWIGAFSLLLLILYVAYRLMKIYLMKGF